MLDLLTPSFKVEPSARPWPKRDWDQMPGRFLGPDVIRSMVADTLHRDVYSERDRLDAWNTVNEMHLWAREHNPGIPNNHGIYLLSAELGGGKSLWAIAAALTAYAHRAVPVFSSESMGALFGWQLPLEDVYRFPDVVAPGSIVLIDEISALADTYSGQANRGRVLHAGMTSFRKGGNLALTATAAESQLAWQLRVAMAAVIEPYVQLPRKKVLRGYSETGTPHFGVMTAREHELRYPKFCYLRARALIQPWQGRRAWEDYRQEQARARARNPRRRGRQWRTEEVRCLDPFAYDLAARLYDTFTRVPISDPHHIGAQQMRDATAARRRGGPRDGGGGVEEVLRWAVQHNVLGQYRGGRVPYAALLQAARHFDPAFEGMKAAVFKRAVREVLGEGTSERAVSLDALSRRYGGG